MNTTHIYILKVLDTDTGDTLFKGTSVTADGIIEEAGKAERLMSARLAELDAALEDESEKAEEQQTNI